MRFLHNVNNFSLFIIFIYRNQLKNAIKRKIYEDAGVAIARKQPQPRKRQSGGNENYGTETLTAVSFLFLSNSFIKILNAQYILSTKDFVNFIL